MMGYNEIANQDLSLGDPFKGGRKLRSLVPRPYLSPPTHNNIINTTCLTGLHNPTNHLLSLNNTTRHHFVGSEEGNKEVVGAHQVMVSSRWNPTPEQLRSLEELYRRGTRTPSAEQIQHITAQLRRYGKIEGKNVFYWFQNHKARERQKRRRQLQLPLSPSSGSSNGGNRIGFEAEQKRAPSSTNKDESDPPIQIGEVAVTKADTTTTTPTSDGWIQQFIQTPEFQHNHNTNNNNNNITNIFNNDSNINVISTSGRNLLSAGERNSTWQQHTHNNNNNIMVPPCSSCFCCNNTSPCPPLPFNFNFSSKLHSEVIKNGGGSGLGFLSRPIPPPSSGPTLQLFPLVKDDDNDNDNDDDVKDDSCVTNDEKVSSNNNPFPYYEFL